MMGIKFKGQKEKYKILIMAIFIAVYCFLSYYFHAVVKIEVIFTHFFYIPIIFAALWWKRKGLLVAILFAAILILSHIIFRPDLPVVDDCFRALIFIVIAFVIVILTERITKTEEALREKSDYLNSLLDYANAPIIVWNPGLRVTRFNHAFERLAGYTADEVIGQELGMFFPEGSRDESLSKISKIARSLKGEYWELVEIPILRKDGDMRLVLWNSANIYAKDSTTVLTTIAQGTDITERKAAEDALAASKAYTESIIQNFLDTLIVVDAEAKIQTVNPETCHLLGYTEEELMRQPVGNIFAEEEEEEVRRVFQFFRQRETGETLRSQDTIRNRELTYKTKDGRLIPMLFNASVLNDEGGNVIAVVAGAKDITELKLAEAEIRKEKRLSENIIATVPESLIVLDKDFRIKRANRSFYKLFQTEPEKVMGSKIADILGDEDGKLSAELTKLVETEDTLENFELRYQSEKLGERILNITARGIIFAEEEEEEEELVVIQDITKRKRAAETLLISEQNFRDSIENSPLGIRIVNEDGKNLYANRAMLDIYGYSSVEELEAVPRKQRYTPESYDEHRERIRKRKRGEHVPPSYEISIVRSDGQVRYLSVSRGEVLWDGEKQFLVMYQDVTGRKQMEEELGQSLERSKKAMEGTIQTVTSIVEMRDPYTAGHQRRVAELACAITKEMGFSEEQVEGIRMSARIHDIGKIYVPAEILSKPGRLTEAEFGIIKSHPQVAYDILKTVEFPWPICDIVLQHHERMDGSGYPTGLSGEGILMEARILAVADAIEAMASHRPYRPSLGIDKALEEISQNRGVLYDPEVVDACLRVFTEKGYKFG
ncbi:MAG: PAS domain S-box protein [Thermodesulfovibrionales bacterium]|nr:PAS domain S-box protein [Thermodesulfovibrionales bacterium]